MLDLRQVADRLLGIADAGESPPVGGHEAHLHRRALLGQAHDLRDREPLAQVDFQSAVAASAHVGRDDLVIGLEVGLDGTDIARETFGARGDDLLHEGFGQEAVRLEAHLGGGSGGRGFVDGPPDQRAEHEEEERRGDGRQLGAHDALAAELAGGHALDVLRHEGAPVTVGLAAESVAAAAEQRIEEAHGQRWSVRVARARAGAAMRRTSAGKSSPTQEALLGIRLVAVMPGIVLISRK